MPRHKTMLMFEVAIERTQTRTINVWAEKAEHAQIGVRDDCDWIDIEPDNEDVTIMARQISTKPEDGIDGIARSIDSNCLGTTIVYTGGDTYTEDNHEITPTTHTGFDGQTDTDPTSQELEAAGQLKLFTEIQNGEL